MSLIKLNATYGLTGTLPAVSGANLTNVSAGKVGQVVSTTKTDTTSVSQSSSFADVSGLSVTITPTATSSKVLVMCTCNPSTNAGHNLNLKLVRGSTDIGIGNAGGSRSRVSAGVRPSTIYDTHERSMSVLDTPNTTSATTYKLQWRQVDNTTAYLNRSYDDNDDEHRRRLASTITVMEILA